jgi:DDE domain
MSCSTPPGIFVLGGEGTQCAAYLKVQGRWCYLYRAIDREGNLIDTMLSATRDMRAAKEFFRSARSVVGFVPDRVTTDGHNAYPRAIRSTLGRNFLRSRSRHNQYVSAALATPSLPPSRSHRDGHHADCMIRAINDARSAADGARRDRTVAFLMILYGLAEVVTGFTHQFFGVTTANGTTSAYESTSPTASPGVKCVVL